MTGSLILLVVCYAVVALLLLALCIATPWSAWIKGAAIVLVSGFFMFSYEALNGMLGYASSASLPQRFHLHSAILRLPDPAAGDRGSILVWASTLHESGPPGEPRAYVLPFRQRTHDTLSEALERTKEGLRQIGTTHEEAMPPDGRSILSKYLSASKELRLDMQDLPEPSLPEK